MALQARIVDGINRIAEQDWEKLDTAGNPFLNWHFLNALESSQSVAPENGWAPNHFCLFDGDQLVAAMPAYIKSHSRGEFVFDWAWADAYHRNSLPYFPKLLTAVPWTPVSGPRLLVMENHPERVQLQKSLIQTAISFCEKADLSSWHCNFIADSDMDAFTGSELLQRRDCQFHWHNRNFKDFSEFLSTLKSKKRKNIRHERRQVADAGVRFDRKSGGDLSNDDISFMHECYCRTFYAHGNLPALSLDCFRMLVSGMPDSILAVMAYKDDKRLAMSFYLKSDDTLYGRYWGTQEELPGLHFETAYYQGIEFCIEHELVRFESGAQGEHKIARGFEPVATRSFHHIRHPGFRSAIADYLENESEWVDDYQSQVNRQKPFRVVSRG